LRWFFYRNQEVVIVGAEIQLVRKHITYLNFVKKVTMFSEVKIQGLKIMEARVRKTENMILMNHDTVEVLGDEQVVTRKALNKLQMKNLRFQLRFLRSHWAQTKY
jgi:thioredoxin reductase (NADPH)